MAVLLSGQMGSSLFFKSPETWFAEACLVLQTSLLRISRQVLLLKVIFKCRKKSLLCMYVYYGKIIGIKHVVPSKGQINESWLFIKKPKLKSRDLAQWAKALASKPEKLSLKVLIPICGHLVSNTCCGKCVFTHIDTLTHIKSNNGGLKIN